MQPPPGTAILDMARLTPWFVRSVPGAEAPLSVSLLAGGRSNLTYEVSSANRSWVLRRPPLGHVLASAHDMSREYRVISALAETPVPVPEVYALCDDPTVIGAPFFVMEKMKGRAYRTSEELSQLGRDTTRELSVRLVDILVALHAISPQDVGLSDFGRPDGYLARQVRRWRRQLEASHSRTIPGADELWAWLEAHTPKEAGATIVHGDFRLDNVLFDGVFPTAVVDWEMATLGDPLTDLALFIVYQRLADLPGGSLLIDASRAEGFLSPNEVLEHYARQANHPPTMMEFYVGLAFYKLAVIFEGIHYRHLQGATTGEGFDNIGDLTEHLIAAGLATTRGL